MKNLFIILESVSVVIILIGILFKINHWTGDNFILIIGAGIFILTNLLWFIKYISNKSKNKVE